MTGIELSVSHRSLTGKNLRALTSVSQIYRQLFPCKIPKIQVYLQ